MRSGTIIILAFAAMPGHPGAEAPSAEPGTLCVRNTSAQPHVFAVEAPDAGRRVEELAPGERLCVRGAAESGTGVVSVFEGFDSLEGCSRLVPVGRTEDMLRYVDFDRCFWSSNSASAP